uniref:Uncharacterized protein n=1 Tax=Rhizochromulina marina TaxID=1034831 RepID=A0A7S2SPT0_9STRA
MSPGRGRRNRVSQRLPCPLERVCHLSVVHLKKVAAVGRFWGYRWGPRGPPPPRQDQTRIRAPRPPHCIRDEPWCCCCQSKEIRCAKALEKRAQGVFAEALERRQAEARHCAV